MAHSTRSSHRRQHSTPVSIGAQQLRLYPDAVQQKQGLHPVQHPMLLAQGGQMVSSTNPGQQQPQQHLQVAQQQQPYPQARPGQQPPHVHHAVNQSYPISLHEFRQLQHQQLDAQLDMMMRLGTVNAPLVPHQYHESAKMERSRSQPAAFGGIPYFHVPHNYALAVGTIPEEAPRVQRKRPSSSHSASFIDERIPLHPDWSLHLQRPFTPPNLDNLSQSPLTPVASPRHNEEHVQSQASSPDRRQQPVQSQTQRPIRRPSAIPEEPEDFAMDPDETLKPKSNSRKANTVTSGQLFVPTDDDGPSEGLPSPTCTFPVAPVRTVTAASIDGSAVLVEVPESALNSPFEPRIESLPSSPYHPQASDAARSIGSYSERDGFSSSNHSARTSVDWGHVLSPHKRSLSPHAMSIGDLSLDGAAEDTGVSSEEVQSYIGEQDPTTGKWMCLYPECAKIFGRKENIRSHVQTHLGDRPYRCSHCEKRFVRQHDLKRHRLIHLGNKPHQCQCGRGFARQDALTRHKQRGICEGAFENVVRKTAKRGRPRKHRPEEEDTRADKAAKTRQRAADRACASSVSGESRASYLDSPPMAEGQDFEGFPDLAALQAESFALPPSSFSYTPPMSPYSTGNVQSPRKSSPGAPSPPQSAAPSERAPSPESAPAPVTGSAAMQRDAQFGSTIGSQISSHPNSPPELSHSSPPSSTAMLEDFSSAFHAGEVTKTGQEGSFGNEYDMFDFSAGDAQPSMELFGKSWNENAANELFLDFKMSRGERSSGSTSKAFNDFDEALLFSDSIDTSDAY